MKKEVALSFRVDRGIDDILRTLAEKEDRSVAWVIRKLVTEARKLLKAKSRTAKRCSQ